MKNNKKIIVIIEGPSGVGKDAVMKGLMEKCPIFLKIPSIATRKMREGEIQGNPYFFVTDEEFEEKVKSGEIFERTMRHGTHRGMSKKIFDDAISQGYIPIKDCDKIGFKALKKIYGDKVFGIFLTAPKETIYERLKARGEKDLKLRLANYDEHMKQRQYYDVEIENIDLDKAIDNAYNKIMKFYNKL